jgi:hypothetical protein
MFRSIPGRIPAVAKSGQRKPRRQPAAAVPHRRPVRPVMAGLGDGVARDPGRSG